MPRQVNGTQPYQDKLVKLIPTEIVGAYMVLAGILGYGPGMSVDVNRAPAKQIPESTLKPILIQVVFFVLVLLTPLYLSKVSKVRNILQLFMTTVSFSIWVYTLGGPFVVWNIYYPLVASVMLVLWSLIAPLLVPSAG